MKTIDIECPTHGKVEIFAAPSNLKWGEHLPCPIVDSLGNQCNISSEYVPGNFGEQPDDLWMGRKTDMGYVTSRSEYERRMKEKGVRYVEKGDERDISRAAEYRDEHHKQEVSKIIDKTYREWKQKYA